MLQKEIIKELTAVKKEFGNPRRTQISDETAKVEIDEKALIAEEDVRVLVSRDGYIKRSSMRSYQSTESGDNGLPETDRVVYEGTLSTLTNLYLFTNYGNLIYRPVHELTETKWKDVGQHLSQELGLAADEQIIQVYALEKLDDEDAAFLMATNDGFIKQVALKDLQPTRTYRSRAIMAMKLKSDTSRVISVDLVKASEEREVVLLTNQAFGLRYDLSEVPMIGARAAGVKSINLKDDDYVVACYAFDPAYEDLLKLGLVTQRGAFKQMKLDLIGKTTRAKRGVLVLRNLKTKPHRLVAAKFYGQDHELTLITSSMRKQVIRTCDHPLGDRQSNGSFVIDVTTDGEPRELLLGKPLTSAEADASRLFLSKH